ncbi:hypothetical protein E4U22_008224 [Claviceps purpurea]|nr:hypothetical protein E4U22_008224 [Claviceps purpurea]
MPVFSRSAGDDQTVHKPRYPDRYLGIIRLLLSSGDDLLQEWEVAWLKSMMLQPQRYDKTWVLDRVHARSALIYLNSDELDYEVGSSESSRGSASVTARFVTIEASPEFAWNDDPQPVRLATRRANLCATVEDADDEDESEPLETIKGSLQLADASTLESKGMPISEMLDDQLPEAVPLVREKLVEERPRRVRGSNFVVKLIAVEIDQSSQLIEREPDRESMSCHSKEPLIG